MIGILAKNKLLIGGLALFIGIVGWYTLKGGSSSPTLLVTENVAGPTNEAEKDLVATLLQLRSVTLDGTIFSDPAFMSLIDYGIEIVPEPVGRANPFAPLQQQELVPNTGGEGDGAQTP